MGRLKRQDGPRILTFDLEARPSVSMHWQHRGDMYIGQEQMLDPGGVMAWSAQWVDSKRVMYASDHHNGHEDMLAELYELLESADVICGYNQDRYDSPFIDQEFDAMGWPTLPPTPSLDLLKIVRKQFKLPHNTLKYVSQRFKLTDKVSHDGWSMWRECVCDPVDGRPYLGPVPLGGGCEKRWRQMKRYARQDAATTTELFWYLRRGGRIRKMPHVGHYGGNIAGCPACGSTNRTQVRDVVTTAQRYPAFRCTDCNHLYKMAQGIVGSATQTRAI